MLNNGSDNSACKQKPKLTRFVKACQRRHPPLETLPKYESLVLKRRYEYRAASVDLLKQLILKSETRTITPASTSQDQKLSQHNARA